MLLGSSLSRLDIVNSQSLQPQNEGLSALEQRKRDVEPE